MTQQPLFDLPDFFKVPGGRTLKTEVNSKEISVQSACGKAHEWLSGQTYYNRIEIKYGKMYIVLAKLKENENA